MKTLNFFPYYEDYLIKGVKTTTFRIEESGLATGDAVMITVGWTEEAVRPIREARIRSVTRSLDFAGESPDCMTAETTRLVLGAIYRKVLTERDEVSVVKFDYVGM